MYPPIVHAIANRPSPSSQMYRGTYTIAARLAAQVSGWVLSIANAPRATGRPARPGSAPPELRSAGALSSIAVDRSIRTAE